MCGENGSRTSRGCLEAWRRETKWVSIVVFNLKANGILNQYDPGATVDKTFKNALAIIGTDPAILVKSNGFDDDYKLYSGGGNVVALPNGMTPSGGSQWLDATNRMLLETNDKNTSGSRSGDLVLLMNSATGAIAVAEADQLPGWHGSPSKTESEVPMLWYYSASAPTQVAGVASSDLIQLVQEAITGVSAGQLRSLHFKKAMTQILGKVQGQ